MDIPPPSPRESNQQLSCNEDPRQPNAFTASHQSNYYSSQRSASGPKEYTSSGHQYTLSTCATTTGGPSTSQTWVSGPATIQISNGPLPDNTSSQADTSLQASTRITPVETVALNQQTTESSSTQPIRITSSQQGFTYTNNSGPEQGMIVYPGEMKPIQQNIQTEASQTSQQWNFSKNSAPGVMSSSVSGQPTTTTQWLAENSGDQATGKSQFSQQKHTTSLTAYNNQNTNTSSSQPTSNVKPQNDNAKDFYNRAFESFGGPPQPSQAAASRQMSSTSVHENSQIITNSMTHQRGNSAAGPQDGQQTSETSRFVYGEPRETVRTISSQLDYSLQKVSENVVRREYGEARIISSHEQRVESQAYIKSERFINHEIKVPKRVSREQITERVVVEQEKKIVEEIVQDTCMVKEKIIEWSRPRIIDKVIEQPEIVHEEVTINVTETIARPRIVHRDVPVKQVQEVIKHVVIEKPVDQIITETVERPVEVEVIKYVDDIQNVVVPKEVTIPGPVIEVPEANVVQKDSLIDVQREIPVPVEAELVCEVKVAEIKPRYKKIAYPVYLPKFIEVPMAVDLMTETLQNESSEFVSKINGFTKTAASLCDIENLASNIMRMDHGTTAANLMSPDNLQATVAEAWNKASMIDQRVA